MLLEIGQHTGYFSVNWENAKPEGDGKQTNYKRQGGSDDKGREELGEEKDVRKRYRAN